MARWIRIPLLTLALLAAPASAQEAAERLAPVVKAGMAGWQVPGLALALIRPGRPPLARTWGQRDAARGLPVTEHTGFGLGSITKTMTAMAIDALAADGVVSWDEPAVMAMPDLRFAAEAMTRAVTLRDLMSHRTGMARHDALWYFDAYDGAGLLARLRYLPQSAGLRATYQYNNLMVAVAGFAAAHAAEQGWAALVRGRVLAPLGMTGVVLDRASFRASAEPATGYYPGDAGRQPIPLRDTDPVAPAAGAFGTVLDVAKLAARLAEGGYAELRRHASDRPDTSRSEAFRITGYGAGLYIGTFRGAPIHWHWGVIDGFGGMISFRPGTRDGVVVLTNLSGRNPVPTMVTLAAYDALDGRDPMAWPALYGDRPPPREKQPHACPAAATGATTRPRTDYVGVYEHPAYGRAEIVTEPDNLLVLHMHGRAVRLDGCGGDAWMVRDGAWPIREGLVVRFRSDAMGKVDALLAAFADGPTYRLNPGPLTFRRTPVAR
jgi:CubicO group peptidase (beta-lactamase class C family)